MHPLCKIKTQGCIILLQTEKANGDYKMKNTKKKKGVKILLLLLFIMILGLEIKSSLIMKKPETVPVSTSMLQGHSFDWNNLRFDDPIRHYSDENFETVLGIDVSYHQGEIDWQKVKNSGVGFAMIRVGYRGYETGKIVEDSCFEKNVQGALDAGVEVGFYFFSQAISEEEAREEANFVLERIKNLQVHYPIVFDMEIVSDNDRIVSVSMNEKTRIAKAFCEEIKENGYDPMIYGSTSWLLNRILMEEVSEYPVWVAEYSTTPSFPHSFQMWQYTKKGSVDGIEGDVDMNLWFKNKEKSWGDSDEEEAFV